MGPLWEIVGGVGKGGVLVREGQELESPKASRRLATGALVEELELVTERLHFRLVSGEGPSTGWISVAIYGRELARRKGISEPVVLEPILSKEDLIQACREAGVEPTPSATEADLLAALADLRQSLEPSALAEIPSRVVEEVSSDAAITQFKGTQQGTNNKKGSFDEKGSWVGEVEQFNPYEEDPYQLFGIAYDATDAMIKSAFRKLSRKVHPDRCPGDLAAAQKFQQLVLAKEFLLDPYQRRAFNEAHGFLTPTLNVAWWSDWEEIFAEIEPELDEGTDTAEDNLAAPQRPLADTARVDVLIVGASGITGTMACMVMQRKVDLGRTWAIAGRDGRKLQRLAHKFGRGSLFRGTFHVPTRRYMEMAIRKARIVLDCTGPSHDVGQVIAQCCISAGAHLVDNTGDAMFSKEVKDQLDASAKKAKVCLLLHAGYVSVPTDFGVWKVIRDLRETYGVPTRHVNAYTYTQGFVMSGTSLLTGTKTTLQDLREAGGPFVLGGVRPGGVRKEDRLAYPHKDRLADMIAFPGLFVERPVVRATCGLMDDIEPYGPNFYFNDWFLTVDKKPEDMSKQESAQAERLSGIGVSLGGGQSAMVEQKKIPPPGWGPKERIRQETFVSKVFVAAADGRSSAQHSDESPPEAHCVMNAGPGGVGDRYEGTATIMIDSACCLLDAIDGHSKGRLPLRYGWGTPVYHLAHLGFFDRLCSLGFHFQSFDGAPSRAFMQRVFSATLPISV